MKKKYIKALLKGTHNDTHHQDNAHPNDESYGLWWDAADQCILPHGTYIHIMI